MLPAILHAGSITFGYRASDNARTGVSARKSKLTGLVHYMIPKHSSLAAFLRSRSRGSWTVLITAVVSTAAAAVCIAVCESVVVRYHDASIVLGHVQGLIYEIDGLQAEGLTEDSLDYGLVDKKAVLNVDILDGIRRLRALAPVPSSVDSIEENYLRFSWSVDSEFMALIHGDKVGARLDKEIHVDGDFTRVAEGVGRTEHSYERAAAKVKLLSWFGTYAILLVLGLVLGLVFAKYLAAVRKSALREQMALRDSEQRFRMLEAHSADIVAIVDRRGDVSYLSPSGEREWFAAGESSNVPNLISLAHPSDCRQIASTLQEVISRAAGDTVHQEARFYHRDRTLHFYEAIFNNLSTVPNVAGIVVTCHNIDERMAFTKELTHRAFHDPLTGLPNRALFLDRLDHALSKSAESHLMVAVLFIDIDHFKLINDSLGHQSGDALLVHVAERLKSSIRGGDTVARLGGDEFTILLDDIRSPEAVEAIAQQIGADMRHPVQFGDRSVSVTASIGLVTSRQCREQTSISMLRQADAAMYRAKMTGKGRFSVYDESMKEDALDRLDLEADLRFAIARGQIRVVYQPIIDLKSGDVVEAEALVRWMHPERGLMSPDQFIPLAEDAGLIVELGTWVLRQACAQAAVWRSTAREGDSPVGVSVNISAHQLMDDALLRNVRNALNDAGLPPHLLKLEITESVMMHDLAITTDRLNKLRTLGVKLAVDDFGTGYSSMSYLCNFPVDTLKIDRAFVARLCNNPEDQAIIEAIIALARSLRLQVTSEGIETREQMELLTRLGSDYGQGYFFARPAPDITLSRALVSWKTAAGVEELPVAA